MRMTTLDTIVRSALLDAGLPIHWYLQFLHYAQNCLRELSFDDIHPIQSLLINVNQTGWYVELPSDYVDKIRIGVRWGQYVRPLIEDNTLNRMHDFNSSGDIQNYYDAVDDETINYGYYNPLSWVWNFNALGESTGGLYGFGAGFESDVYKIIKERNQIQFSEKLGYEQVVLDYISDGSSADAAAAVEVYAIMTIKRYIEWQRKEHSRTYGLGERQLSKDEYYAQRKKLRSRKNTLTPSLLKRIMSRNYMASPNK